MTTRRNRKPRTRKSAASNKKTNQVRLITGKCRSSYMKVLRLEPDDNGNKKCGTTILIPKKDRKTIKAIKQAIRTVATNKFGSDIDIFKSKKMRQPLHDGDELSADPETNYGKEVEGYYVMTSTAYRIPQVVNRHNERIMDPDELEEICVSGYHFYFSITIKTYEVDTAQGKSKGVRCLLNNLMYLGEGERLDGGKSAEEEFESFAEEDDDFDDDDID